MKADDFNALHKVGTPVFAYPGARPEDCRDATRLVTRTRSKATVLGGHTDVVWVDGHSSCIALSHVDVVSKTEYEAAQLADAVADQGALPMPVGPAPLALPWAHEMSDDDLHDFLGDLVSAAVGRWQSDPEVPDRTVLANLEKVCANWRQPGLGPRSDDTKPGPLTVYRAEHPDSGITLGHYGTEAAARAHCEATERRAWAASSAPTHFGWIEDADDGVAEMTAFVGGEECTTGYLVTALEVPSEYDEEADQ